MIKDLAETIEARDSITNSLDEGNGTEKMKKWQDLCHVS